MGKSLISNQKLFTPVISIYFFQEDVELSRLVLLLLLIPSLFSSVNAAIFSSRAMDILTNCDVKIKNDRIILLLNSNFQIKGLSMCAYYAGVLAVLAAVLCKHLAAYKS